MAFDSLTYLLFLAGVAALFFSAPKILRVPLLVGASLVFYAAWSAPLVGLILISAAVDFGVGLGLERAQSRRARRLLLALSVTVNLGLLAAFKYAAFVLENLQALGLAHGVRFAGVATPPGISFYTFQTLSYSIDVYRRALRPTRSPLRFLLYVSFFPQLIAGPIERAGNLLLQLRRAVTLGPSARNWAAGLQLILLGLFKKAVLADHLAPYADAAFADPSAVSGWTVIVGTYAFALQIYFDFSAYSEIAKGSARLFGVDLVWNFDQPYLAGDIAAFWRRWHMSLSSWFRDYVFIPLGGSRGGRARALRNLVITMFLSGLWHGAAWSFVLWGLYHGALLLGHALWRRAALAQRLAARAPGWYRLLGWLLTFELVTLGWILFRAAEDRHIPALLRLVASPGAPDASQLVAVIGVHALCGLWYLERRLRLRTVVHRSAALSLLVYGALAVITALFARDDGPQFIYFQF